MSEVVNLDDRLGKTVFPDRFRNTIYHSANDRNCIFSYDSTFSIKYTIEGAELFDTDGKVNKVKEKQFLIVDNHCPTTTFKERDTYSEAISIFLDPDTFFDVAKFSHDPGVEDKSYSGIVPGVYNLTDCELSVYLRHLHYYFTKKKYLDEAIKDDFFFGLSELLLNHNKKTIKELSQIGGVKLSTRREIFRIVNHAQSFLLDNISRDVSLDDLSLEMGLSKYYLHRTFRKVVGKTPSEYLKEHRLDHSKELLRISNKSISEVASECGYSNIHYFSNAFRKEFSISPSEFRKQAS